MGFPLALAVKKIGAENQQNVAWAWGVNGAASVVGSCLVMVVAVFTESRYALGLGAVCYALAALVSYRSERRSGLRLPQVRRARWSPSSRSCSLP